MSGCLLTQSRMLASESAASTPGRGDGPIAALHARWSRGPRTSISVASAVIRWGCFGERQRHRPLTNPAPPPTGAPLGPAGANRKRITDTPKGAARADDPSPDGRTLPPPAADPCSPPVAGLCLHQDETLLPPMPPRCSLRTPYPLSPTRATEAESTVSTPSPTAASTGQPHRLALGHMVEKPLITDDSAQKASAPASTTASAHQATCRALASPQTYETPISALLICATGNHQPHHRASTDHRRTHLNRHHPTMRPHQSRRRTTSRRRRDRALS